MSDIVGPWSEGKLKILGKYLSAYTVVLSNWPKCKGYHYIDAFAASGLHESKGEERKFIDGSPRVALKVNKPFTSYTFIEKNTARINDLEKLKEEFTKREINIVSGDCNQVLIADVAKSIRYKNYERGFVFLDPYGLDVYMSTIKCIAENRALEVLINFSIMAYNRTVGSKNPKVRTQKEIERMVRVMGDDRWINEVTTDQYRLKFDEFEDNPDKINKEWSNLVRSYRSRLKEHFKYVSKDLVMTNETNAPLYALFFASHNDKGCKIMNDIIRRYQRTGGK